MKYAEYKQTGTLWIESIPAEWRCQKIASLFTQRKTKVSDKEYPALSVAKIGVVPQLETAVKTDAGDNRKLVCAGDFVINSRSDRKGSCGVAEQNGSVSLINIVLTPRQEWNNRYVHYLLRSQPFAEEYYHYGRGIVADLWTTRYSEMKNIMLPVPPREEQDQIVCYLDWQVSKINKLIAARKKQITLLKELRKAITDEGILHGYTSSAMKDSGVFWLGSVPEHWSVKPLKRVCRVNASIAHLTAALNDDTRVTFLPMENVSVIGEVDCTIKKPLSEVRSGFSSFAKGDVVVAKITPCFENGKGACLDSLDTEIGFGTTEFINLRPSRDINPKYLYASAVFTSTGNHQGLKIIDSDYQGLDMMERVFTQLRSDYLTIPAEPKMQFFSAQKEAYDRLSDPCFSYSGPTSMGKSFIMRMFIKDEIINGAQKNYALIVPTKALINEVRGKIIDDLADMLSSKSYRVVTAAGDIALEEDHNFVLVLTPERLLYLLISKPDLQINYLFIDEAHKLSGKNSRGPFYYKVVDMLMNRPQRPHFIFASPNIPNPQVYLRLLLDAFDNEDENMLAMTYSPVIQVKYLMDFVNRKIEAYNEHTGQTILIARVSKTIENNR